MECDGEDELLYQSVAEDYSESESDGDVVELDHPLQSDSEISSSDNDDDNDTNSSQSDYSFESDDCDQTKVPTISLRKFAQIAQKRNGGSMYNIKKSTCMQH